MSIISAASDAFSNPDSPLYYIVGVAFLLLIFAALGVYIVFSGKKKKRSQEAEEQKAQETEKAETAESTDEIEREPVTESREQSAENIEKSEKEPEQEQAETEVKAEDLSQNDEKAENEAEKPKTARRTTKPFIDRLIAAEKVHLTYNAIKNAVLSYPGVKASLTKKEELFYFGEDKKASIDITDETVELKLAIAPDAVPAEFSVEKANGDLPTAMSVTEEKVAQAEKLITFAMNVSLLTKNEKHRYVDYVQNAVNAKNRAKRSPKG